jgi:cytidylate kinase
VTPRVVAIDGAAGSGKSTLARLLAEPLGLPYVNTGAMYRALTLAARRGEVDVEDEEALVRLMDTLDFTLSPIGRPAGNQHDPRELWIDGAPPSDELESADVESNVSAVAKHPAVRAAMRAAQRALGEEGAVMEGRDIGTAVFPDAPVKVFLIAEPDERAGRRVEERRSEDVAGALHERDRRDARVNPLVPADDAVVIDTSDLGVDATVRAALAIIAQRAPELLAGRSRP